MALISRVADVSNRSIAKERVAENAEKNFWNLSANFPSFYVVSAAWEGKVR